MLTQNQLSNYELLPQEKNDLSVIQKSRRLFYFRQKPVRKW